VIVVIKSTVPVGTNDFINETIDKELPPGLKKDREPINDSLSLAIFDILHGVTGTNPCIF
jgi:UDP-glucose 6-dehydrogenase